MRLGSKPVGYVPFTALLMLASLLSPAQTAGNPSLTAPHSKPKLPLQTPYAPVVPAPSIRTALVAQKAPPNQSSSYQSPPHQSPPNISPKPQTEEPAIARVPATAPRVSYQNGELTVLAENASLSEVLSAIRAATGIRIEGESGGTDRVMAKIGPAPVRDVLLSLLEGSRYDFAMLGSVSDPQKVDRLVLSARVASTGPGPAPAQQAQQQEEAPPAADTGEDDDNAGFAPAPPQKPVPAPAVPGQVKTPEQLLEDLRKLEADRQQQQQQQPADPNAPRPSRPVRPK